ncbi:MAG: DUF2782 domain-containing protein [Betaproteobacteria bacterium]|nr:MAG: DUF2782 domain-containing protein [Betaproteobacteria bacterium]TDI81977.1 MAG: DUF2782 domain-containing protein [Betaproteobacteria bacterium]
MHLIFLVLLLLSLAAPATAQSTQPSNLQEAPLPPELPELPLESPNAEDPLLEEPQVVIKKRGEDRIEEYSLNGRVYVIKVTPRIGFPYYLIDDTGDGTYIRDGVLEDGIRPPMWVIYQF